MKVNDITITSLETITGFDIGSGAFKFTLDELQSATISQSQETTDITGKQGRKISTLKRNKAVTISGTNGLFSHDLMAVQTGGSFSSKQTEVLWVDYLTVGAGNSCTTSWTAIGTTGAEIEKVLVLKPDGTISSELTQAGTAAAGKFQYTPNSKALKFYTDIPAGTEVVAYYKRKITANVLENRSDVFSEKCALYIDAIGEDKCGNVYRVQFYIPKADFSGELSIEMGDNQTVHSFEATALAGACGAGGQFFTYTVFGANTADSTSA